MVFFWFSSWRWRKRNSQKRCTLAFVQNSCFLKLEQNWPWWAHWAFFVCLVFRPLDNNYFYLKLLNLHYSKILYIYLVFRKFTIVQPDWSRNHSIYLLQGYLLGSSILGEGFCILSTQYPVRQYKTANLGNLGLKMSCFHFASQKNGVRACSTTGIFRRKPTRYK